MIERIGSLFSGVGLLELGLLWSMPGARVSWQVERDPFCRQVLERRFPGSKLLEDVHELSAISTLEDVDLLCGGFPCQPWSAANPSTGEGASVRDARGSDWRAFCRAIASVEPAWIVVENVASGARRWVDACRSDLEQLGWSCFAVPMSARDVGAPHIRRRVFLVAYSERCAVRNERRRSSRSRRGRSEDRKGAAELVDARSAPWRTAQPSLCRMADDSRHRLDRDRLKALGNGCVPQCAQVVGELIALLEKH
jgi:DNA (cytosine-5)-methyltransferase 1